MLTSAVAQDQHVYLTWKPVDNVKRYIIHWHRDGENHWNAIDMEANLQSAVTNLQNGVKYNFYIEGIAGSKSITSPEVTQVPKPRPNCSYPNYYGQTSFFCAQTEADAWLHSMGISPSMLKCRNQPLQGWNLSSPDCLYQAGDRYLLLLRSVDATFTPSPSIDSTLVPSFFKRLLWPQGNPFDNPERFDVKIIQNPIPVVGQVTKATMAATYRIIYHPSLSSRITCFKPREPKFNRFAIYCEGHGGASTEIGAETIDWLLNRGWEVVSIDMPLVGVNKEDISDDLKNIHDDFNSLDDGFQSPVGLFFLPVKAIVDLIYSQSAGNAPVVLMIGRSGGGWLTYAYSALDPRIDIVVSVAGGLPLSMRLKDREDDVVDVGDYEQSAPHVYNFLSHEDLMVAAGRRASFYIFNQFDSCCFRVRPDDEFVEYLRRRARVYVDHENHAHSISTQAYQELDEFLASTLEDMNGVMKK